MKAFYNFLLTSFVMCQVGSRNINALEIIKPEIVSQYSIVTGNQDRFSRESQTSEMKDFSTSLLEPTRRLRNRFSNSRTDQRLRFFRDPKFRSLPLNHRSKLRNSRIINPTTLTKLNLTSTRRFPSKIVDNNRIKPSIMKNDLVQIDPNENMLISSDFMNGTLKALEYLRELNASANQNELKALSNETFLCSEIFTGEEFYIRSPNYPFNYPAFTSCRYVLKRFHDQICGVEMTILRFDLPRHETTGSSSNHCDGDRFVISGQALCGRLKRGTRGVYRFFTSMMSIEFQSSLGFGASGFLIKGKQITNCSSVQPFTESSKSSVNCTRIIKDRSFSLQSPGYPSNYPHELECHYFILQRDENVCGLMLTPRRFSVEGAAYCMFDYIEIQGKRICGNVTDKEPLYYMFENKEIDIRFRTDESVTREGFVIDGEQISCDKLRQFQPIHSPIDLSSRHSQGTNKNPELQDIGHALSLLTSLTTVQVKTSTPDSRNTSPIPEVQKDISLDNLNLNLTQNWAQNLPQNLIHNLTQNVNQNWSQNLPIDLSQGNMNYPNLPGRHKDKNENMITLQNEIHDARNSKTFRAFEEIPNDNVFPQDHVNEYPFGGDVPFYVENDLFRDILNANLTVSTTNDDDIGNADNNDDVISTTINPSIDYFETTSPSSLNTFSIHKLSPIPLLIDSNIPSTVGDKSNPGRPNVNNFFTDNQLDFKPSGQMPIIFAPCNQLHSKPVFTLKSPNYPNQYPNSVDCVYYVQKSAPDICQLRITVNNLDIANPVKNETDRCLSDYFDIAGFRLCGNLNNKIIHMAFTGHQVVMSFHSDTTVNARGFLITVEQISDNCQIRGKDEGSMCNAVVNQTDFTLVSPGYPNFYSFNLWCRTTVRKAYRNVTSLQIHFDDFQVEASPECSKDHLLIGNKRFCGQRSGNSMIIPFLEDSMDFTFVSNEILSTKGFRIRVTQISENMSCGGIFSSVKAVIMSPRYPNKYPNNQHCRYTVFRNSPEICLIQFQMTHFDIEGSPGCRRDYFKFGLQGPICGQRQINEIRTYHFTGDKFTMIFHSDNARSGKGFKIKIFQKSCQNNRPGFSTNVSTTVATTRPPPSVVKNQVQQDCLSDKNPTLASFLELKNKPTKFFNIISNSVSRPRQLHSNKHFPTSGNLFQNQHTSSTTFKGQGFNNFKNVGHSGVTSIRQRGSRFNNQFTSGTLNPNLVTTTPASNLRFATPSTNQYPSRTSSYIQFSSAAVPLTTTSKIPEVLRNLDSNDATGPVHSKPNLYFPLYPENCNWCKLYTFHQPYIINYSYSKPQQPITRLKLSTPRSREVQQSIYVHPTQTSNNGFNNQKSRPRWIRESSRDPRFIKNEQYNKQAASESYQQPSKLDSLKSNEKWQYYYDNKNSAATGVQHRSVSFVTPVNGTITFGITNRPQTITTSSLTTYRPTTPTLSGTRTLSTPKKQIPLKTSSVFSRDLSNDLKLCNKSIASNIFSLTSPGYPQPSFVETRCFYPIYRSDTAECAVSITIHKLDITPDATCSRNYLSIAGRRLCGLQNKQIQMMIPFSPATPVVLEFRSDIVQFGSGFSLSGQKVPCKLTSSDMIQQNSMVQSFFHKNGQIPGKTPVFPLPNYRSPSLPNPFLKSTTWSPPTISLPNKNLFQPSKVNLQVGRPQKWQEGSLKNHKKSKFQLTKMTPIFSQRQVHNGNGYITFPWVGQRQYKKRNVKVPYRLGSKLVSEARRLKLGH